jgi:hypothetical protein
MKPYFHELTDDQRKAAYGITAQKALDTYAQPDWCKYPDAMAGIMGCW